MTHAIDPAILDRAADAVGKMMSAALSYTLTKEESRIAALAALQSATPEVVEECAKIAEMFSVNKTPIHPGVPWLMLGDAQQRVAHMPCQCVAEAIRARSAEQKGDGDAKG